jgi:hypothetical protein
MAMEEVFDLVPVHSLLEKYHENCPKNILGLGFEIAYGPGSSPPPFVGFSLLL